MVRASLPMPMITTFDYTIPFNQGIYAEVKIITEDQRLLERFLNRLVAPITK